MTDSLKLDFDRFDRLREAASAPQKAFMAALAGRQREPHHGETPVTELEHFGESRIAAVMFFKELANVGCGQFKTGRRGKDSRLIWSQRAIEVAKAFINSDVAISRAVVSPGARPGISHSLHVDEPSTETPDSESVTFYEHKFLLRPSLTVKVSLPLDLKREEAGRLADFIRAIPF